MKLLSDGRILTVGNYVAQYLSNGRSDSSFGTAGKVPLDSLSKPLSLHGTSINILSNGKIIVSGVTYLWTGRTSIVGGFVLRLRYDGSLDSNFGQNGVTLLNAVVQMSTVQSDGKIVTSGPITLGFTDYVFVNRLNKKVV